MRGSTWNLSSRVRMLPATSWDIVIDKLNSDGSTFVGNYGLIEQSSKEDFPSPTARIGPGTLEEKGQ